MSMGAHKTDSRIVQHGFSELLGTKYENILKKKCYCNSAWPMGETFIAGS